jgi:hypothetical protein
MDIISELRARTYEQGRALHARGEVEGVPGVLEACHVAACCITSRYITMAHEVRRGNQSLPSTAFPSSQSTC